MKKKKSSCPEDDETAPNLLNTITSNQNTQGGWGRKQTPLEKFADSILNFNENNDNKTKTKKKKKEVK